MEPTQKTTPNLSLGKTRQLYHQMIHHRPIQRFRHLRFPSLGGMNQVVPARRRSPAHPQSITDVIQPDRMRQLRIHQSRRMAPRCEGPGLLIHAILPGQVQNHMPKDKVEKLFQNRILISGWTERDLFFHASTEWQKFSPQSSFFISYGTLIYRNQCYAIRMFFNANTIKSSGRILIVILR